MELSCFSLLLLLFFHIHFVLYAYIATFCSALGNALCKLFHGLSIIEFTMLLVAVNEASGSWYRCLG